MLACVDPAADSAPEGSAADAGGQADTDDTRDTDDTTDTGETADTDPTDTGPTGTGLLTWEGEAVVSGGWIGTEDVIFAGDMGLGDVLCDVQITIESVGTRTDCAECSWAYDVELTAAEVLVPDACDDIGYDADAIAALVGTTRGYGYAENYLGHANVLMVDQGSGFEAAAFADWNDVSSAIAYSWDQGYLDY